MEDTRVVVGRGPLVEVGGNKFGKLKLKDIGVGLVIGRGPLMEIGCNKFGKLTLKDTGVGVVVLTGMGLSWEGLERFVRVKLLRYPPPY